MRNIKHLRLAIFIIALLILAACSQPTAGTQAPGGSAPGSAPLADYGDAPEGDATGYAGPFAQRGNFPTTFASNGARVLDLDQARLGPTASAELDANDPSDPDGFPNLTNADSDDGLTDLFISLIAIPPPTTLSVDVFGPPGSAGGNYYVNALIDLNMDGEWGGRGINGEMEWVVQNEIVQVVPGTTTPFTSQPFAFSNGNLLPDGAYMRIALTKEMVPPNWDGTGEFSAGEIEDHIIFLPQIGGKDNPILTVDCNGPYRPGNLVFCTVTNHRAVAGTFNYSLRWISGGTVNVPLAGCAPGGPGGGPVAIGASGVVVITCGSTPGKTPTTWRFTARVNDPDAVVVEGGIELGHSAESTADFDFEGEPKTMDVFVAQLIGGYTHFAGFSVVNVDVAVYGDDPVPMEGAEATLTMRGPGGAETQTVTTDAEGMAKADFKIFVYGNYEITVEDITGEYMTYVPALNAASSILVEVGPGASTPVGTTEEAAALVVTMNRAFQSGDADTLFENLHPAVLERYGAETCRTYLGSVIEQPVQTEILSVSEPGEWLWELDGVSTVILDTVTAFVDVTSPNGTSQSEVHYALREDGRLGWFTDCGEPLP